MTYELEIDMISSESMMQRPEIRRCAYEQGDMEDMIRYRKSNIK